MSHLHIYKASAGSGKTFTLTKEYIDLLSGHPSNYRNILAVTFTNKATAEMKSRILNQLYRESSGKSGTVYANILSRILHDFSHFHIETIDHFFQKVIRSFTRELGLGSGYTVELDNQRVLSEAVDRMLFNLDQDEELQKWLVDFAREKIQDGRNWNLKTDILQLGKQIFRESFQSESENILKLVRDRKAYSSYISDLISISRDFEGILLRLGKEAVKIMSEHRLVPGDFKGAYGAGYYLEKISGGNIKEPSPAVIKCLDTPDQWYARDSENKEAILQAYETGLNEILRECLEHFTNNHNHYLSAESVRSHLHSLGILAEITAGIRQITDEQNLFLLSDANYFLSDIIGENDAPFIYEKIGNYYHHYLIDEFQDTSVLQWKNFKLLIDNSLAANQKNLLVGDVKQAIYRWRNSDWEILSERLEQEFDHSQLAIHPLDTNWRSLKNIVHFNNSFFTAAKEILAEKFRNADQSSIDQGEKFSRAYADILQSVPDDSSREGGMVSVSFVEGRDWKDQVQQKVRDLIRQLLDKDFALCDIAILVRTGKDGKLIAEALLEDGIDVISNDSLYLNSSLSVRIVISTLKYINDPGDQINLAMLMHESGKLKDDHHRMFRAAGDRSGICMEYLPDHFEDEIRGLRFLSLVEIIDQITAIFGLNRRSEDIPYLLALQDIVLEFSSTSSADINSFLNWWEVNGDNQSITVSEDQNAIQIMTIHKSKGLQFRNVIVPYCNWKFDHTGVNSEILWCHTEVSPFNKIQLLPVRYSSRLANTIFCKEYEEEHFKIFIDHLNLLYVALTRAEENLFVFAPQNKSGSISDVSHLLKTILQENQSDQYFHSHWKEAGQVWVSGKSGKHVKPQEDTPGPGKAIIPRLTSGAVLHNSFKDRLRILYHGTDFFDTGREERKIQGNWMHAVFELIQTGSDVNQAVEQIYREGKFSSGDKVTLGRLIHQKLLNPTISGWFDGSWDVMMEQDIIVPEGMVRRPDRVMIKKEEAIVVDYKFGMVKSPSHSKQVKDYMKLLDEMNYKSVTGFIWYFNLDEIVNVRNTL